MRRPFEILLRRRWTVGRRSVTAGGICHRGKRLKIRDGNHCDRAVLRGGFNWGEIIDAVLAPCGWRSAAASCSTCCAAISAGTPAVTTIFPRTSRPSYGLIFVFFKTYPLPTKTIFPLTSYD